MSTLKKDIKNPSQRKSVSIIAQSSEVEGNFDTPGTLIVYGSLTGDIKCDTLEIGKDGRVNATIEAHNVNVGGSFNGEILCSGPLFIANTGHVKGRISYGSLFIEAGGLLEGYITKKLESKETKLLSFKQVDRS